MTVTVNLQFMSISEAVQALSRILAEPLQATLVTPADPVTYETKSFGLAHADRPDVGNGHAGDPPAPTLTMPALPIAQTQDPAVVFGGAVAPAAPTLVAPAAPTAPAAPSAPTVGIAPTAAPAGVELDSTGLPWDARIHASTKTKVASGAWTAKRNVDATLKAQVEALLRGTPVAAPAAPAAPVAPPAAPVLPVAAAAPAAPAAPMSFAEYMAHIGAYFSARPVDAHNHMTAALVEQGMQNVSQLAARPDLIPVVDARFKQLMG
jgi:hypothetical protein